MSTYDASKCFIENRNLFGNAESEPEKYNLYNGLAILAEAIEGMERTLRGLEQDVEQIKRRIK
jgi:hypothetical protein